MSTQKLYELDWTLKLWKFLEEHWVGRWQETLRSPNRIYYGRERRLWDKIRVDILTETYATEVDWAPKFAEAIGQSLLYAEYTQKKPGIVLLVDDFEKEAKYVYRCKIICTKYNISLWLVDTVKSEAIDEKGVRYTI